jgi:hypothetical protein
VFRVRVGVATSLTNNSIITRSSLDWVIGLTEKPIMVWLNTGLPTKCVIDEDGSQLTNKTTQVSPTVAKLV